VAVPIMSETLTLHVVFRKLGSWVCPTPCRLGCGTERTDASWQRHVGLDLFRELCDSYSRHLVTHSSQNPGSSTLLTTVLATGYLQQLARLAPPSEPKSSPLFRPTLENASLNYSTDSLSSIADSMIRLDLHHRGHLRCCRSTGDIFLCPKPPRR